MSSYKFRIMNVFTIAGDPFSGNPLCVFENAAGLDEKTMQALALQFNLSETTFILPSEKATANVRIFTPCFEMPFAGHPTLGTAQVIGTLKSESQLTLEMKAGIIPVSGEGNRWTLRANAPVSRPVGIEKREIAEMLGLREEEISAPSLWVNTGSDQWIIPLATESAVDRVSVSEHLLKKHGRVNDERFLAYVWAPSGENSVKSRFFFRKGGGIAEDPATGSACANLGGWFLTVASEKLPIRKQIRQGDLTGRPSLLELFVDEESKIFVSGTVMEIGRGSVEIEPSH